MKYFCLIALCASLWGEIIEANHFKEISSYGTPKTLVILDIDDTLLIPVQTLGTDVWFCHRLEFYLKDHDYPEALDKALAEWEAVRHLTHVKIVEEGTPEIIGNLQANHTVVMGLTTQGVALATRTIKQLHSLSIDLFKTAPSHEDHYFLNHKQGVLYRKGILFTSGSPKGEALLKLLDTLDDYPERIVFINDKKSHLEDVERSLTLRGIPFTGLRYSYSDERVLKFCPDIAEIQWTYSTFGHILSDEEALEKLPERN